MLDGTPLSRIFFFIEDGFLMLLKIINGNMVFGKHFLGVDLKNTARRQCCHFLVVVWTLKTSCKPGSNLFSLFITISLPNILIIQLNLPLLSLYHPTLPLFSFWINPKKQLKVKYVHINTWSTQNNRSKFG